MCWDRARAHAIFLNSSGKKILQPSGSAGDGNSNFVLAGPGTKKKREKRKAKSMAFAGISTGGWAVRCFFFFLPGDVHAACLLPLRVKHVCLRLSLTTHKTRRRHISLLLGSFV